MTSPEGRHVRSPRTRDERGSPPSRRKAVLFCPECGHEDPVDGDWVERDDYDERVRELACPKCTTVVTGRPLPQDSDAISERETPRLAARIDPWKQFWVSTLRFWFSMPPNTETIRRAN